MLIPTYGCVVCIPNYFSYVLCIFPIISHTFNWNQPIPRGLSIFLVPRSTRLKQHSGLENNGRIVPLLQQKGHWKRVLVQRQRHSLDNKLFAKMQVDVCNTCPLPTLALVKALCDSIQGGITLSKLIFSIENQEDVYHGRKTQWQAQRL